MFLINSCLGLFTAADLKSAPLLPKLRGHFAEFLNEGSLAHLSVLHLTTCVGSRYGLVKLARSFSRQFDLFTSLLYFAPHHTLPVSHKHFTHDKARCLDALFHQGDEHNLLCPSITQSFNPSTGISTCYPSPIPIGFSLGPD